MIIIKNKNHTRLLMFLQSAPPQPVGGAEIHTLRLCKKLIDNGFSVTVITLGTGKIKGWIEWEGVPIYCLFSPLNYLLDLLFFLKKKKKRLTKIEYNDETEITDEIITPVNLGARFRYWIFYFNCNLFLKRNHELFDVFHVMTLEWLGYVACLLGRKFNKKVVLTESTVNGITNVLRYPKGKEKQKLIIQQAFFVAISSAIRKKLEEAGVPKNRIEDIYNGIEIDNLKKNYTSSGHQIIFVGNLYQQPAKGIDILLKAWPYVLQKVKTAKLLVVGDGNINAYNSYLKERNLSNILFMGKRDDVNKLLLASDIFVLPSRREGMPNALMEAMLRGLPCVATNISGAQDLIINNASGILVEPKNVNALANAIIFLLENPFKAMALGREGRKVILQKLDMNVIAEKYKSLYKTLL
jgi:glycosyltransferase involved in cell wall biosynthesis